MGRQAEANAYVPLPVRKGVAPSYLWLTETLAGGMLRFLAERFPDVTRESWAARLERGEVVEQGEVWRVFGAPRHEVTRTLLAPLQARLPAALQASLRASPVSRDSALVLKLTLLGEPELSALFNDLGGRVRLLQGGVETIGEHALGQLILSVQHSPHDTHQLLERARRWAEDVEVLGHVV